MKMLGQILHRARWQQTVLMRLYCCRECMHPSNGLSQASWKYLPYLNLRQMKPSLPLEGTIGMTMACGGYCINKNTIRVIKLYMIASIAWVGLYMQQQTCCNISLAQDNRLRQDS